jgi:hypothetical protein
MSPDPGLKLSKAKLVDLGYPDKKGPGDTVSDL